MIRCLDWLLSEKTFFLLLLLFVYSWQLLASARKEWKVPGPLHVWDESGGVL